MKIASLLVSSNPWIAIPLGILKSIGKVVAKVPARVWLILAVVAVLGIAFWWYGSNQHAAGVTQDAARTKPIIEGLNARIGRQADTITELRTLIGTQNAAIDKMKADGEAGNQKADQAATVVISTGKARRRAIEQSKDAGPAPMNSFLEGIAP